MIFNYPRIWKILNLKEKRDFVKVTAIQFFSGLLDTAGVASVIPFLAVISNTELMETNKYLFAIKNYLNVNDITFLTLLGIFSITIMIFNQLFKFFSAWYEQTYIHRVHKSLSIDLFGFYLKKPYLYHVEQDSKALLEKVAVEANIAISQGFFSATVRFLSYVFTSAFVFFIILLAQPLMTLTIIVVCLIYYFLVIKKIDSKITYLGKIAPEYYSKSFKLLDQAFSSIKEIKVKNNEKYYTDLFNPLAELYRYSRAKKVVITNLPTSFLEIFVFSIAVFATLFLLHYYKNISSVIPIIGLFTVAMRKIIPSFNGLYTLYTSCNFTKPSFDVIEKDLLKARIEKKNFELSKTNSKKFTLKDKIKLQNINFKYPSNKENTLSDISLDIKANSNIGIVGLTGSGKTTLIDLILGLFDPLSGKILIDGTLLDNKSYHAWQSSISYIPQFPFMANDTIIKNIALGIPEKSIDLSKIKEVARVAEISNFIENELPEKYNSIVGDQGLNLSGGQRQRLSIARSLYSNPGTLIMDEATNALDKITEKKIMNSIMRHGKKLTLIMVTHRVSSLRNCDKIFLMEKGKILNQGTYEHLVNNNSAFEKLSEETESSKKQ